MKSRKNKFTVGLKRNIIDKFYTKKDEDYCLF